jgi:hypothetical protein
VITYPRYLHHKDKTIVDCLACSVWYGCNEKSLYCKLQQARVMRQVMRAEDLPAWALPRR